MAISLDAVSSKDGVFQSLKCMSYLQAQMHIKTSQHIHKGKMVVLLAKDTNHETL